MFRRSMVAVALAATGLQPLAAAADDSAELKAIREQIRRMSEEYEARLRALEQRLQDAERRAAANAQVPGQPPPAATPATAVTQAPVTQPTVAQAGASAGTSATAAANAFNPAMSLILAASYARLSQDPDRYRIQGFIPGGEDVGPGSRNFNLGESELTLSANIDHRFFGQMTMSVDQQNEVSLEEAFFRTQGLGNGINVMAGRFLSGVGYLNSQHAHAWDFSDAPLAYQAFFGGQYRNDGILSSTVGSEAWNSRDLKSRPH